MRSFAIKNLKSEKNSKRHTLGSYIGNAIRKINNKIESEIYNASSLEELYAFYNSSKGYKKYFVGINLGSKLKSVGNLSQNCGTLIM